MASKVKVDDRVWRRIAKELAKAGKASVRVGVLSSKTGNHESGVGMVELAAIHEFGSPARNIPERSFIRSTFKKNKRQFKKLTESLAAKFITGKMNAEKMLNLIGLWGAAEVKKFMTTGPHIPPPLQPGTVARKGSDRPLVDTGALVNSINYEVTDE